MQNPAHTHRSRSRRVAWLGTAIALLIGSIGPTDDPATF